ncbi:hypothetical protein Bca101_045688 [Brassica carinata]
MKNEMKREDEENEVERVEEEEDDKDEEDSLFQSGSSLSKLQLPHQTRLCWKPTELFIPSFLVFLSSGAKEASVALVVQSVYSRSEIVIGGSRGFFSIVIMYGGATPSQRSTCVDDSKQCLSSSSAKKLTFTDSVCSTQTFMTKFTTGGHCNFKLCSSLFSWTDSIDKWLMCGFSKIFGSDGNVGGRSLCLTSATASLSNLVKLIYLNAVVKVARPSLSGVKYPSLTTIIHSQQLLNFLYSLVLCSHMSNAATDPKIEISSKKTYVLGIDGLFYVFGAVDGDRSPRSSKIRHHPENPTSKTVRQIQSVVRSPLMLEDCSPVALIEKADQTSSCRGIERSYPSFLLFVEVNLSTKIPLYERHFSLGFKAKEYCHFPNRLLSCVMVCLGPEDTTRLIPMRFEVLELSTSRYTVTISEFGNFNWHSKYSMSLLASGTFEIISDFLSNLFKFVSLSLFCLALKFLKRIAHHMFDVVFIHVTV